MTIADLGFHILNRTGKRMDPARKQRYQRHIDPIFINYHLNHIFKKLAMNTQGNRIRECWRIASMILLAAAPFGIAGSRASAQDSLCERITASMTYQGQGCCWLVRHQQ